MVRTYSCCMYHVWPADPYNNTTQTTRLHFTVYSGVSCVSSNDSCYLETPGTCRASSATLRATLRARPLLRPPAVALSSTLARPPLRSRGYLARPPSSTTPGSKPTRWAASCSVASAMARAYDNVAAASCSVATWVRRRVRVRVRSLRQRRGGVLLSRHLG